MKIVDFHAHIYPSKISEKAVRSIGAFYGLHMDGNGTAEGLIASGTPAGLMSYVVHSVAVTPSRVLTVNDFIAEECAKHLEFYGYGTMHPEFPEKQAEVDRMLAMGLSGVKLHPDMQFFNIDDARMMPFYEYLQEKHLPILFHCGDYRWDYSHPARLCKIMDAFPRLTVIAAHFGGWSIYDLALEYLRDRNCYLDTSSSFHFIGSARGKELIRIYGAERILFGTDYPMWTAVRERDNILRMGLTDGELEKIFYQNAAAILGL